MRKFLCRTALILLLTAALLASACWFYADQLLDDLARPQLEKLAAQTLGAEVRIGLLAWTESGLRMDALQINAPGQGRLDIPSATADFTFSSLWQRRLKTLQIDSPNVEIFLNQSADNSRKKPLKVPEKLPLRIDTLTVQDGQLLVHLSGRRLEFHQLNFSGALRPNSDFQLSALFGSGEGLPLATSGSLELLPQQVLTLQKFSWQNQPLLNSPLSVRLTGAEVMLGENAIRLQHFDNGNLSAILTALDQHSPLPADMSFSLRNATLGFSLQDQALNFVLDLEEGLISWNNLTIGISAIEIQLDQEKENWSLAGRLRGPAGTYLNINAKRGADNRLVGQAQLEIPAPDRLKTELFGGPAPQISGGLQLAANFKFQEQRFELTTEIQGQVPAQAESDHLLNISQLNGLGQLLLTEDSDKLMLNLRLASQPFFSASGNFQQLEFTLTAADLLMIRQLFAPGKIPARLHAINALMIAGEVSREEETWTGDVRLKADQIAFSELKLSAVEAQTRLLFANQQLAFTTTSFSAGIDRGDQLSAQLNAQVAGRYSAEKTVLILQELTLAQLNYLSPDGQNGLGEAVLTLQGEVSAPTITGPLNLTLEGTVAAREVLAGVFYADLSAYQGTFSLTGNFSPDSTTFRAEAIRFSLPQLGTLSATGELSPGEGNLQTQMTLDDLAESYGEHIGPLLRGVYPALAELTLEGSTSIEADFHWQPEAWLSNGKVYLEGLDAYWQRQQLEIVDGTGAIPFVISSGKPRLSATTTKDVTGKVSFGSLSVGLATLEEGELQLAATNNRFSFRSPLLLQLAGGRVAIKNLSFGWPDGQPQGSVDIDIREVDLQTLTEELKLPVMQGNLSADLGTLGYTDRALTTGGLASIDVFGGNLRINNMRFHDPFSSYPIFHSDIDFSGIDLLQATRTFDFGEMNGVLDGHIHGVRLFGSTPSAFKAAVATRPEGKRNISVKALNNLSILSQGGISAALSRGIYQFIDFYRYRQIGFECSLENDTFKLVGTALPGSERYLVHGGLLPPRIDITTTTPTNSFKEKVNRLR